MVINTAERVTSATGDSTRGDRPALIHELPGRLRFRVAWLPLGAESLELERALASLPGIRSVRVNAYARSVRVEHASGSDSPAAVLDFLAAWKRGERPRLDKVTSAASGEPTQRPDANPHRGALVASCAAMLAAPLLPLPLRIAVTVVNISGTVLKAVRVLWERGLKIEVLDALAVSIAAGQGCYFTANTTRSLLKLGEYLDHDNERKADSLLESLLRSPGALVWVERDDELQEIAVDDLTVGELVSLGPGSAVPVDGRIETGYALIDVSSLTGESIPLRREVGDALLSGSWVIEGHVKLRAERVGDHTTSARINRYLEEAIKRPSEMQRLADRLGDRLVFVSLALGALLFAVTRDPRRVASVFLVDYACALKLGTPITFKSAMYRGGKAGILFKGAGVVEALAGADTVIFDKTGTLTEGLLEVTDVVSFRPEQPPSGLLALVASLEEHTHHPFADAIVREAQESGLAHIAHGDVEFIVAHGLRGSANGRTLLMGSRHFLEDHEGVDFGAHEDTLAQLALKGKTLLLVAEGGVAVGVLALRDRLRADAADTLNRLRQLGVRNLVLLTGDDADRAGALSEGLDLDRIYAQHHPEEKAAIIRDYAAAGHSVVFVGDGVNDAPGLASAAASVCMPRGAPISRELSGLLLLRDQLSDLIVARQLAMRAVARVRSNFNLDVGINSAVLIAAAGGWLHPLAASLIHNATTLGIMIRAARSDGSVMDSTSR